MKKVVTLCWAFYQMHWNFHENHYCESFQIFLLLSVVMRTLAYYISNVIEKEVEYKLLKEEFPMKGKCEYTFFLKIETETILKFSEAI